MPTTYKLISKVTVGAGGAATISFTSIPATYTDLQIVFSVRSNANTGSGGYYFLVKPNGSTSSQTMIGLYNSGGTVGSFSGTTLFNQGQPSEHTANVFNNSSIYIPNYTGSNNKSLSMEGVGENNGTSVFQQMFAGLWSSSSAITSLEFANGGGNFVQYSTARLYGIKNS